MVTRTAIADLNPKAKDWMQRAIDEHARRNGRIRELVLRMLATRTPEAWTPEANGVWQSRAIRAEPASWNEPTLDDVAAALLEAPGDPIPPALLDCAAKVLRGQPRKTGPKEPARTTWQDIAIQVNYQRALRAAREEHEAHDSPATRDVKRRAAQQTARAFGLGVRTIETIVAPRSLLKSSPK
jgi:hypothetical protein